MYQMYVWVLAAVFLVDFRIADSKSRFAFFVGIGLDLPEVNYVSVLADTK